MSDTVTAPTEATPHQPPAITPHGPAAAAAVAAAHADTVTMRVWRGDPSGGHLVDYSLQAQDGEVVLDVVHRLQATVAPDLACRWNCKAGKCGSCSAEINGEPHLMCMTRVDELPAGPITVTPMRTFPIIRDLVTDVSFNYEVAKRVPAFAPPERPAEGYRMQQVDVERSQEFRKCIECFMCQNICHVIRDHEENKPSYAGPRFFIRYAELEMHPLDTNDRRELVRQRGGLGLCNITKCCTEVCPEHIKITDNAIIPMKERVVDASYDPVAWLGRKILRRHKATPEQAAARAATDRPVRIYSAEWVEAFNRAASTTAPAEPDDGGGDGDSGDFRLLQVVHDAPEGTLHIGLESAGGRLVMTLEPPGEPPPQVTLSVAYDDAVALSRGDLDPARLVATGRVKVRGNLSVLLDGQAVLAEVAARVAELSGPAGA